MSPSTERTPLLPGHHAPSPAPASPPASPLSSAFAGLTAANGESAEQHELAAAKLRGRRTAADLTLREKTVVLFGCTLACFLSVSAKVHWGRGLSPGGQEERAGGRAGGMWRRSWGRVFGLEGIKADDVLRSV